MPLLPQGLWQCHPLRLLLLQVMWMEGFIVFCMILSVVLVALCCMHSIDVPSRFASTDHRRPGHHHHD